MSGYMELMQLLEDLETAGFKRIFFLPPRRIGQSEYLKAALPRKTSVLIAAFPYPVSASDEPSTRENPMARIESFAQRHYYKEAVIRLKAVFKDRNKKVSGQLRFFCNSRFPEGALAVYSGIGFRGRNNLIIHPSLGTRFVIAGCMLPEETIRAAPNTDSSVVTDTEKILCKSCGACAAACPSGAISSGDYPGITYDKTRCIQYYTTLPEHPPDFIIQGWGDILYGCGICQEVCPYNRAVLTKAGAWEDRVTDVGYLGPSLSITGILSMEDEILKRMLKGSALGLSWLKPDVIKRNALLAALGIKKREGALPERLISLVRDYLRHPAAFVRAAAFAAAASEDLEL